MFVQAVLLYFHGMITIHKWTRHLGHTKSIFCLFIQEPLIPAYRNFSTKLSTEAYSKGGNITLRCVHKGDIILFFIRPPPLLVAGPLKKVTLFAASLRNPCSSGEYTGESSGGLTINFATIRPETCPIPGFTE